MRLKTPRDYGLVIREERRRQGLTQQALATAVGVGRQWIIAVEQGKAGAELGLVLRTLQVLGAQIVRECGQSGLEASPAPESNADTESSTDTAAHKAPTFNPTGQRNLDRARAAALYFMAESQTRGG